MGIEPDFHPSQRWHEQHHCDPDQPEHGRPPRKITKNRSAYTARSCLHGSQQLLVVAFSLEREHAQLAELDLVWRAGELRVQLKARALKVLHQPAIFRLRLADWQSEDRQTATVSPETAELLANQVFGRREVPDQLVSAGWCGGGGHRGAVTKLDTHQANQHRVACAVEIGMELQPRALEILNNDAVWLNDRLCQWQAEDIDSAAAAPEPGEPHVDRAQRQALDDHDTRPADGIRSADGVRSAGWRDHNHRLEYDGLVVKAQGEMRPDLDVQLVFLRLRSE